MNALRAPLTRLAIGAALAALAVAFAGERVLDSISELDSATIRSQAPELGAALVILAIAPLFLAAAWIALLEATSPRARGKRAQLSQAFAFSWLGRYVPGTLPFFAGKVMLGQRLGIGTRHLLITTAVQNALEVLVSTSIGAALVVASLGLSAGGGRYALLAVVPALPLIALHPRLLYALLSRGLRAMGRDPLRRADLPPVRAILVASACVACNQAAVGAGAWLVMSAVAGVPASDALLVTGAMSLAGVAGILIVVAPAGLGVRDGVLAAILAARVGAEAATLGAIVLRALSVLADLLLVLVVLIAAAAGAIWQRAHEAQSNSRRARAALRTPVEDRAG